MIKRTGIEKMSQLADFLHQAFDKARTLNDFDNVDDQLRLAVDMAKISDEEAEELENIAEELLDKIQRRYWAAFASEVCH